MANVCAYDLDRLTGSQQRCDAREPHQACEIQNRRGDGNYGGVWILGGKTHDFQSIRTAPEGRSSAIAYGVGFANGLVST